MANWSFEQFLGYVLIHAASSDQEIVAKELKFIERKVGKEILDEMMEVYEDQNDVERLDTILSYKSKYYPTQADVDSLIAQIEAVDSSDHDIDAAEQMTIMMLKKLLK
jgi:hypothetical protein